MKMKTESFPVADPAGLRQEPDRQAQKGMKKFSKVAVLELIAFTFSGILWALGLDLLPPLPFLGIGLVLLFTIYSYALEKRTNVSQLFPVTLLNLLHTPTKEKRLIHIKKIVRSLIGHFTGVFLVTAGFKFFFGNEIDETGLFPEQLHFSGQQDIVSHCVMIILGMMLAIISPRLLATITVFCFPIAPGLNPAFALGSLSSNVNFSMRNLSAIVAAPFLALVLWKALAFVLNLVGKALNFILDGKFIPDRSASVSTMPPTSGANLKAKVN